MTKIILATSQPEESVLEQQLTHSGFQIIVTSNKTIILKQLRRQPDIDLLLLEYPLAGLDDCQIIQQIREIPSHQFLPIVVMAVTKSRPMESKWLAAGVTGWLNQPVQPEQVIKVINRLLS